MRKHSSVQVVVEREVGAEIVLEQLRYSVLKRSSVSGSPASARAWVVFLELGEHRLAEDRAADGVDLAVDEERPLADRSWPRCISSAAEQLLVERAGHFGHEDRVVVILKRLVAWPRDRLCIEWPASWASVKTWSSTSG